MLAINDTNQSVMLVNNNSPVNIPSTIDANHVIIGALRPLQSAVRMRVTSGRSKLN